MTLADWAATMAAILTTVSFLPQAIHVLKTRDTGAISLLMYVLFTTGVGFWEVYGWLVGQPAIIVANLITFALAGAILFLKVRDVMGRSVPPA